MVATLLPTIAVAVLPGNAQSQSVFLSPGTNIQAVVNAHPENTTFILQKGFYRLQSIQPKNGDSFIGQSMPVLSGAQVLTSFVRSGTLWVAGQQYQQGQLQGYCDSQHPMCMYPEDLFFDSVPLIHVTSTAAVVPGSWYFDYPNHNIYFADDPTGHVVETSVTRSAFSGSAANVSVSGIIVEKYAIPAQFGAIGDQSPGPNWIVRGNEVRWNHGAGIALLNNSQATMNYVHHNGQKGIGGVGTNILVQGNRVSYNNWAGFDAGWEAGGMKFALTNNLVVRGNSVHDNTGPGIWSDIDSVGTLFESNVVYDNKSGAGIVYEISRSAVIRYNSVCNNSTPGPTSWLWGSQILIQNSGDVQVYGNTVETPSSSSTLGGNGIGIIQQNRGSGPGGPRLAINNSVHNNTIVYRGGVSASGETADYNLPDLLLHGNNTFDYNTYHLSDPNWYHWAWGPAYTFEGFKQAGLELHGSANSIMPATSCTGRGGVL